MVQQISIATLLISLLGTCTSGGQSLHQTEDRLSYHLSVRATDHHRCLNINDYKHIFDDAVQQNCEPSIALFDKLDKIRQRHHECLRPLVINIKKLNLSSCHCHSNGFSYNFVSVHNGRFQECRRDEHYREAYHTHGEPRCHGTCSTITTTSTISGACKPLAPPTDGQINCGDSTIFYRCTAQCNSGYQFDNGDTTIQKDCDPFTGQFFDGPSIPKCIPTCSPACQNGGTCVQPNVCSCAPGWGGTFCESPETMNCSKILTVTELARFQQLYPHFNTDCSNNNSVSNLIMSDLCDVPVSQFWRPGQRVVDSCGTLSLYSAVATFTAGGYPADGLAGVFVGCTSSTIKIATQECGGKFEILEISRHSIHPTSFIHTASNYFTVTF